MHQPTNQMQDTLFNNKQMLIYRDVHKSIRSLKYFSMVPYLKACLHFQISTSNSLQIFKIQIIILNAQNLKILILNTGENYWNLEHKLTIQI
jgi:hypothetical protein